MPKRGGLKLVVSQTPPDGCMVVFNAYMPSWRAAASAVGAYTVRIIENPKLDNPLYADLYITPTMSIVMSKRRARLKTE